MLNISVIIVFTNFALLQVYQPLPVFTSTKEDDSQHLSVDLLNNSKVLKFPVFFC